MGFLFFVLHPASFSPPPAVSWLLLPSSLSTSVYQLVEITVISINSLCQLLCVTLVSTYLYQLVSFTFIEFSLSLTHTFISINLLSLSQSRLSTSHLYQLLRNNFSLSTCLFHVHLYQLLSITLLSINLSLSRSSLSTSLYQIAFIKLISISFSLWRVSLSTSL